MRLRRRSTVPPDVRGSLPLEEGERVLVAAPLLDGGSAVATDRALLLPVPNAATWQRLPWYLVAAASWDDAAQALLVVEVGSGRAPRHRLQLAGPSLLPETVRERVTSSIVVSQHVPLQGKVGVRIVARRRPDGEGADGLDWQLHFDRGLNPADPGVRAEAERALEELRRQTL